MGYCIVPTKFKQPAGGFSINNVDWDSYEHETLLPFQNGIGVLCGKRSGVVCLDIDVDDENLISEIRSIADSNVTKFGSKGLSLLYEYADYIQSASIRYSIVNKNDEGEDYLETISVLDVLSNGKYTVLPPSKHKFGFSYQWRGVDGLPPKEFLPHLSKENFDKILKLCEEYSRRRDKSFLGKNLKSKKGGRYNSIKEVVCKNYGFLQHEKNHLELINVLSDIAYNFDKVEHDNPWFSDKEEHKEKFNDPKGNAENFVRGIIGTLIRVSKDKPIPSLEVVDEVDDSSFDAERLPELDGELKVIYNHISDRLDIRNHNSIVGASFACLSALIGDLYSLDDRSPYKTTTNVYFAFIKKSGARKTIILNIIKDFIKKTGYGAFQEPNLLGKFVSGGALCDAIEDDTVNIADFDEFSSILKTISIPSNDLEQVLTAVWDRPSTYKITSSMNRNREKLKTQLTRPYLTIIASTTISEFLTHSKGEMLNSGFYNRFLFFVDSKTKESDCFFGSVMMEESIERMNSYLSNIKVFLPKFKKVLKPDEEFVDALNRENIRFALESNNASTEIRARRISYIQKLALIYAISDDFSNPRVTLSQFEKARTMVDACFKNVTDLFEQVNVKSDYDRDEKSVVKYLGRAKGPSFELSYSTLKQKVKPVSTQFDLILTRLEKNGLIESRPGKKLGKYFKLREKD